MKKIILFNIGSYIIMSANALMPMGAPVLLMILVAVLSLIFFMCALYANYKYTKQRKNGHILNFCLIIWMLIILFFMLPGFCVI